MSAKSNQEVLIPAFIISLHKTKQSTDKSEQKIDRRLSFFKGEEGRFFCFCSFKEETKVHSIANKQEKSKSFVWDWIFFAINASIVLFCFIITAH